MHLHFYCLDVGWMNKAKDIQQLKIIWICSNIFSSDNICERSTVSSVDYNIIWPKKGIFMSIFLIFVWQLRSSKKKEDFEKRIEIYQNHRAFSPILVTFKLLQNIVRSSADASPPEHSELSFFRELMNTLWEIRQWIEDFGLIVELVSFLYRSQSIV